VHCRNRTREAEAVAGSGAGQHGGTQGMPGKSDKSSWPSVLDSLRALMPDQIGQLPAVLLQWTILCICDGMHESTQTCIAGSSLHDMQWGSQHLLYHQCL
jgi:hypothetical protein